MNNFKEIKKNFGFGCMRLPMCEDKVDYETVCKMVDTFIENGFNYFDTAHGYLDTKSEIALRECLTKRYPREAYILTNKLSSNFFTKTEEIRPFLDSQLEACGVDCFDFYLMHAQDKGIYAKYKTLGAYEESLKLMHEGKFKHFGISFHDTAEVLDEILTDYPEIEVVQLQINYIDWEDPSVQGKLCYEVCQKHNKPVIVMEPVKGGSLVNLPEDAKAILDDLNGGSYASYAIRYCASLDNVFMVLSGMGNMDMMLDNISYMKDFKKLSENEYKAIETVVEIFSALDLIKCTSCRYCTEVCPKNIPIPELFSCMNSKKHFGGWNADFYQGVHTQGKGKASDCIVCGLCEKSCPQHLPIRNLLKQVAEEFEKNEE